MIGWLKRWRSRKQEDDDLVEELRAHVAIETTQRVERGESAEEAANAARRSFGNVLKVEEDVRETWGWAAMERLGQDLRFGIRMLRKSPVWTGVVSATLALGVGLGTAIFSVVYAVLLQPLPYPQPDRLVALWPSSPANGYSRFNVSAALWMAWRRNTRLFEDIALTRPIANFNLTGDGVPERLQGARTSSNLAQVLRVPPLIGRFFTAEEQLSDARVAVLSNAFWMRRFGGDPSVVGRKLQLNGEPFDVIGIMPPQFQYPSGDFELWTPLYIPPAELRPGMNYQYFSVGRLKPGVDVKTAQAEFSAIMRRLSDEDPQHYGKGSERIGALVESLAQSDAFQVRNALYALLGAVCCLILIGCMNLAVLLIARASARAREMAVRVALGASGGRLRRQMLAEMAPLSAAGLGGGLALAWWILRAAKPYLPANTPRVESIGLHGPVLLFAVGISIAVVAVACLLPARISARAHAAGALQHSSRSVTGAAGARTLLVMAQVAVSLILLFAGVLLSHSFAELLKVQPGFASEGVLTMQLAVTRAKYRDDERVADYYRRLIDGVRSIPGVMQAGIVNRLPFSGIAQTGGVEFEGRRGVFDADWRSATPGYFEAIGIPIKSGRGLLDSDTSHSRPVGVIDEKMARNVFGSENPIGKRFRRYLPGFAQQDPWAEIVGVAGHIHNDTLAQDVRPQVYWPETQRTQDRGALVVRTVRNPESYVQPVLQKIRAENGDQPVYDIRTMEQWVQRTLQLPALLTAMAALFAGASLLLACLGLYGVVSYTAELRLREFGIRMALGARAGQVSALVLQHAGILALCGCAIGLALAWPVATWLQSLLFGVSRGDLLSWIMAPAALIAVAVASALAPARRAGRTDPVVMLRLE